jgi:hypothetical protein
MAKGEDWRKSSRGQSKRDIWARGKGTTTTRRQGKGTTSRTTYAGGTKVAGKTGEHATKKYNPKAKAYKAGSNVLDREKRGKYKDSFKTRADDPRNWEFHYKEPGKNARGTRGGKGGDGRQTRSNPRSDARRTAERAAKQSGQGIYDVREIQYNTAGIKATTKQAGRDAKAKGGGGGFGSTKVAQNLQAQKNVATRRGGGGSGPFDAAKPKKRGMG